MQPLRGKDRRAVKRQERCFMSDDRPAPDSPARPWRRHGEAEPPAVLPGASTTRQARRRRTLLGLAAGTAAVAGAILGWFLLLRGFTEPHFVTIPVTEYVNEP